MSYSIDFHFARVETPSERWLTDVDAAMRRAGLRRLANVQPLEVDEDGEVDIAFPVQHLTSWDDIAALASRSFGVALSYASPDFDLALYAWSAEGIHVACSMDNRQWVGLDADGKFRVGGIMCVVGAILKSSFGFSIINSTFPPHDDLNLETIWSACESGSANPDLAWLADEVVSLEALRERCGSGHELRVSLSGYHIVLCSGAAPEPAGTRA